jgi:hypothetical protein
MLDRFADPEDNYMITPAQDSLTVSILSAGTLFGASMVGPIADIVGHSWDLFSPSTAHYYLGVISELPLGTVNVHYCSLLRLASVLS